MKRIILEMGTGNDLYGADYTKSACRAVQDALHHSSLILFRSLGFDHADMVVKVTIGVQDPEKVDRAAVAATLPRGKAQVTAVKGGQNVIDPDHDQYAAGLNLDEQAAIIARGHGTGGPNTEYLFNVASHLKDWGIADAELETLADKTRALM